MIFQSGETVQHHPYQGETKTPTGHREKTWADPAPINGVGVDVPSSTEPREGTTERARIDLVLYLPHGFSCGPHDRFTIRGRLYEVEGVGEPITNFFTGTGFRTEVAVRRHDG